MNKRIFVAFVAVIMCALLCACGGEKRKQKVVLR